MVDHPGSLPPAGPAPGAPSPGEVPPFNPLRPGFLDDPYAVYRHYRERDPVHWSGGPRGGGGPGAWFVFRHAEASAVLRDGRFGKKPFGVNAPPGSFAALVGASMIQRNPPDHTRLRTLVSRAFAPSTVERLHPRTAAVAADLLEGAAAAAGDGTLDLIAAYASPLPVIVIAGMLGFPAADVGRLQGWSEALGAAFDLMVPAAVARRGDEATAELTAYLRALLARRRREPRDDLISQLLAVEERGDRLSVEELVSMCVLLLAAGHETTVNLIGNGAYALLRHPAQREALRREPARTDNAVEELLRYDAPVQMVFRAALEDAEIGSAPVRRGEDVVLVLGAANHDPAVFAEPERLDLTRPADGHLAFSRGAHYCLGAMLSRIEGRVALRVLLERFPDLRLAEGFSPRWRRPGFVFRGLASLPVRF